MTLADMHPEDIKSEIRKRFRSVAAFERAHELPEKSVTDLLRGYKSARVKRAVEQVISQPIPAVQSECSGFSSDRSESHRQNAGAR